MDGMHTVYCHTHGTITSSNARVGQAAQNPASKGLLSKGVNLRQEVQNQKSKNATANEGLT
jgi:hypothetical protein